MMILFIGIEETAAGLGVTARSAGNEATPREKEALAKLARVLLQHGESQLKEGARVVLNDPNKFIHDPGAAGTAGWAGSGSQF